MTNETHPDICKHCGAEYALIGTTYGDLVCSICNKSQWAIDIKCDKCSNDYFYAHDSYGRLCEDCYDKMVEARAAELGFPKDFRSSYDLRNDPVQMRKAWQIKRGYNVSD